MLKEKSNNNIELEILPISTGGYTGDNNKEFCIFNRTQGKLESDKIFTSDKEAIKYRNRLIANGVLTRHRRAILISDNFSAPIRIPDIWINMMKKDMKTTIYSDKQINDYFRELLEIGFQYRHTYRKDKDKFQEEWSKGVEEAKQRVHTDKITSLISKNPDKYKDILSQFGIEV